MTDTVVYPSLYQINTRVWLRALSAAAGRPVTLAGIPEAELDRIAALGTDWVWLLSVWQTGSAAREVSRHNPVWQEEFREILPDLTEDDICGSGFAITAYRVADSLGGAEELAVVRRRLGERGLKLMLDFVPNHTAPDHPWVHSNPEFYMAGSEEDLAREPHNWTRIETAEGPRILAYGRDPYFAGWPDTLQLDYSNPALQAERVAELVAIADQCDGVRCDMAMLIVPEVFERTWVGALAGRTVPAFWEDAIGTVQASHPGFMFMAEVYWDMEWDLQQQGFDYCYDKRLYDRLRDNWARPVRDHLIAPLDYQDHLARFLENHDEPRAATVFSDIERHRAAAVLTYLTPGLRFFHQGQLDGWRVRVSPHLCRGPAEPGHEQIRSLYAALLALLGDDVFRNGTWARLEPEPIGPGNSGFDRFVAFAWRGRLDERLAVVVNYSDAGAQCRLSLPFTDLSGRRFRLTDRLSEEAYDRDGDELVAPGLFVDHRPWQVNIFQVEEIAAG